MTSALLWALNWFRPIFEWQNIDFVQLRSIVRVKLEMDNRRTMYFLSNQQTESSYIFSLQLIFYFILGGLVSVLIVFVPSPIFSFSIYHSFLLTMLTLTLVSDFSSVLLDTSDNTIVLPRPVATNTFYSARTTHIFLYILQLGLALSLIPIIVTFFKYGFASGLAAFITTILNVVFSVSLTHGLYLLIMRFYSEEKLKSIVNYFQIFMTIFIMGAYQILPRVLGIDGLQNITSELSWWFVFIPPMWFAGAVNFVLYPSLSWLSISAVFLSLTVPFASWQAINKYLAPYFSKKIADLGVSQLSVTSSNKRKDFAGLLAPLFTKSGIERASYDFSSRILSSDRKLKLRVYPNLGTPIVIFFMFLFQGLFKGDSKDFSISSLVETKVYLFIIYLTVLALITIAAEIAFSDDYKASWIFQTAPTRTPGKVLLGSFKAIMAKYFVPMYLTTAIIVLAVWKEKALADVLLGAVLTWLLVLITCVIADKHLPFSKPLPNRNQGGNVVRMIVSLILIGLVAGGHYLISSFTWAVYLAIFFAAISCFFLHRLYQNVTWDDIT